MTQTIQGGGGGGVGGVGGVGGEEGKYPYIVGFDTSDDSRRRLLRSVGVSGTMNGPTNGPIEWTNEPNGSEPGGWGGSTVDEPFVAAEGNGPVNALANALRKALQAGGSSYSSHHTITRLHSSGFFFFFFKSSSTCK